VTTEYNPEPLAVAIRQLSEFTAFTQSKIDKGELDGEALAWSMRQVERLRDNVESLMAEMPRTSPSAPALTSSNEVRPPKTNWLVDTFGVTGAKWIALVVLVAAIVLVIYLYTGGRNCSQWENDPYAGSNMQSRTCITP
jgi:hypothetical protein